MIQTEAIVLHGFDYRETSRIVRLATREADVVSVIARGAKRPKNRFGHELDLFTSGTAQLALHATQHNANHLFDRLKLAPQLQRAGFEPSQIEQVDDQSIESLGLTEHRFGQLAPRTCGMMQKPHCLSQPS